MQHHLEALKGVTMSMGTDKPTESVIITLKEN